MSRPIDPRLLRALPALRRVILTVGMLQALSAVLSVAQAGLLARVIVTIFQRHQGLAHLHTQLILLAVVGLSRAAVVAVSERITSRASLSARARLRQAVLHAVVRLGPGWAARQPTGRLVTASGPGLESMDGYLTRAVPALVAATVVPGIILLRIGVTDWRSAAILLITLPLVPVFMILVGVTTKRRMQAQYETLARLSGHFLDLVQGLTTLKVYGQAHRQVENVRKGTDLYRRQTMSTLRMAFLSGLVLDLLATLSVAVVAVDVGLRLDQSRISLGTALVVLLLAPEFFAPLRAVGAQYHASEEGQVAAAAALDILDEADALAGNYAEIDAVNAAETPVLFTGALRVDDVRVSYPGRRLAALDAVTLQVEAGQVLAVEGPSGGGKSTLLAILLGFASIDDGSVIADLITGPADLVSVDATQWRRNVAWVPQRPCPTQTDVSAEVGMGDRDASTEQINAAINDCQAPAGNTSLGEDGRHISAGQRRRVALARALLRARRVHRDGGIPLVLLDEPSEDLDPVTEGVVVAVVGELAGSATVVMVTHSPRLVAAADRRVRMVGGQITVDELQRPVRGCPEMLTPSQPVAQTPVAVTASLPRQSATVSLRLGELIGSTGARRRLLQAALLSGASGLAAVGLTSTSIWLILRASQHPNVQALEIAVVGVRTFALARALLRYGERLTGHDAALQILADVRSRVFAALEPLAPSGLADLRRGDLLRRFVSDVDGAQEGLVRAVVPIAGAAITTVGTLTIAAFLAPTAAAVLGAGLLVGLIVVPAVVWRNAGDGVALAAAAARRDTQVGATLEGLAELTAYGADACALADVESAQSRVTRLALGPATVGAWGAGLTSAAAGLTLPAVLATVATAATSGSLNPIAVGVLAVCVLTGFDTLGALPAAFAAWQRCVAGLLRVSDLLCTVPPIAEPVVAFTPAPGARGLRASHLTLAPATDAPAVVDDCGFTLAPGTRVAVVGPSGCGKSTLLAAAMRLLPTVAGQLDLTSTSARGSLTTTPLRSLSAADVPQNIAGSLQGDHVFNESLRDNLRVVRPLATDVELDAVAARAGLTEFIDSLDRGWSTSAGPDGGMLSGGQRQRLLLARAFLADPQILVLDEPTAHLDRDTEAAVLRDLLADTEGRTLIMSTHRMIPDGQFDQVLRVTCARLETVDDAVAELTSA